MIVVSNSSPLIALARIHRLDLLECLFQRILVPPEVHHEVTVQGRGLPGAEEISGAKWIEIAPLTAAGDARLSQLCQSLGAGEQGAILLAKHLGARFVLLDEWKARRIATAAGLSVMGCLGILETAARRGLVPDLRSAYITLLQQGIRFDLRLLQNSLDSFGLPKL